MKNKITALIFFALLGLTALPSKVSAQEKTFTVEEPDYKKSPYTGMTRKHWLDAAEYILNGAFGYIHSLDDQMYFPKQLDKTYPRDEGAVKVAKLEGLARTLFIAAPLLKENPDLELNGIKVADYYRHQLINISNSKSVSYIAHRAKNGGPSQTLLELGSLVISMKVAQNVLWDPLTKEQKDDLIATMKSYGEGPTIGSNWMFFNVFIMSFLKDQGYPTNDKYLEENLRKLLKLYRGEGWYNDAPAYDYYSMWAYQTYGPLWAELFGKQQFPDIAEEFMNNQNDMVDNYPYMFAKDGRMNMWGRSICYRFAAVSPLPFLEWDTKATEINYGWLRHIASSSLLQFIQRPEFLQDGVPTMGFYGPFAPAVQIYSCRGSVYWCGKAFLGLMLPEDSKYWSATENEGPWKSDFKKGHVYNKFQPATNLMITDYPNSGAAEMRSWCHETVAKDWQLFRSSENYNKLSYNTEFPWMADGPDGEVSMNYAVKNKKNEWEVLRLYTFKSFKDGIYRRDAVLETDENVKFQLADITLPDGILHIDKVSVPSKTEVRLGNYSLPWLNEGVTEKKVSLYDSTAEGVIIDNGEYQLATIPVTGWTSTITAYPTGIHPVSDKCAVTMNTDNIDGSKIYVTLHLWKKGKSLSKKNLKQIKSITVDGLSSVTVTFASGETKTVAFE